MKNTRILNGYVVVYRPEHPKSMTSENWEGYVYEHIVIAEEDYGRSIDSDEDVHHLDLDRSNNSPSNLIILSKKSHGKLHKWIDKGAFISVNSDTRKCRRCNVCEKPLKLKQKCYCSEYCMLSDKKIKLEGVPLEDILGKLTHKSFVAVGKEYGISDNGLRKHLKTKHGLHKDALTELLDIRKHGAGC